MAVAIVPALSYGRCDVAVEEVAWEILYRCWFIMSANASVVGVDHDASCETQ